MNSKNTDSLGLYVHGASGRMGHALLSLIPRTEGVHLAGIAEFRKRATHPTTDETTVPVVSKFSRDRADSPGPVVIDFSQPQGLERLVEELRGTGFPLVSGTTGFGASENGIIKAYSQEAAVLYDQNMSYGVSVLKQLLRVASPFLIDSMDTKILEVHHRHKRDIPSGTAIALAEVLGREPLPTGKDSAMTATNRSVPVHSSRTGAVVGKHRVVFSSDEEVIDLTHRAVSRDVFARGAIRAATFLAGKNRGLYSMTDLLEVSID